MRRKTGTGPGKARSVRRYRFGPKEMTTEIITKGKTPRAKYSQITFTTDGEKETVRYKETLVCSIIGEAARLLNEVDESGESLMHSYNPDNMEQRELWKQEKTTPEKKRLNP